MTTSKVVASSPSKLSHFPARIRWPVEETGTNSVAPSTRPRIAALPSSTQSIHPQHPMHGICLALKNGMSRENGKANTAERAPPNKMVIIDGSNVAHSSEGDVALLDNIRLVSDKLKEEGLDPVVLVDAALRHQIDKENEFEQLVEDGTIKQAPAGTDADYFILSF